MRNYCQNLKARIELRKDDEGKRHILFLDNLGDLEMSEVECVIQGSNIKIATLSGIPPGTSVALLADKVRVRVVVELTWNTHDQFLILHFAHPDGFRDDCVIPISKPARRI